MTFMAICCFALVTWTIIATGQVKDEDVVTEEPLDEGEGDAGFFEDE